MSKMMVHFPPPKTKHPIPYEEFQNFIERMLPGSELVWEVEANGVPAHYVIETKMTIVASEEELFIEPYDAKNEDDDNIIDLLNHPKFLAAHYHEITESID